VLILIGAILTPSMSNAGPETGTPSAAASPTSRPLAPTAASTAHDDGHTAATTHGWGAPNRQDDFTGDLSGWGLYDGPGHAGKGTRSPEAATVAGGVLTIRGDAEGTTEGMDRGHGKGQEYGRWGKAACAPRPPIPAKRHHRATPPRGMSSTTRSGDDGPAEWNHGVMSLPSMVCRSPPPWLRSRLTPIPHRRPACAGAWSSRWRSR
jgi:hypothetical protein